MSVFVMESNEIPLFYALRMLIDEARPYRGQLPLQLDKAFESAEETFRLVNEMVVKIAESGQKQEGVE